MNYESAYLAKLEGLIVAMGGVVPTMTTPNSFERRSLELLDTMIGLGGGGGASFLVGHPELLPYSVTLAGGIYTDATNWLWYAPNGGSIGGAASGGTVANAKLLKLYSALWTHLGLATPGWSIQTSAGGGSTAGASAQADWDAGKRLVVPDQRGRAILAAGAGSGLTARAVGAQGGAETHAMTEAENGTHLHTQTFAGFGGVPAGSGGGTSIYAATSSTNNSGSGTPHNNMQPWAAYTLLWFMGEKA